jgi:hypothetical protein
MFLAHAATPADHPLTRFARTTSTTSAQNPISRYEGKRGPGVRQTALSQTFTGRKSRFTTWLVVNLGQAGNCPSIYHKAHGFAPRIKSCTSGHKKLSLRPKYFVLRKSELTVQKENKPLPLFCTAVAIHARKPWIVHSQFRNSDADSTPVVSSTAAAVSTKQIQSLCLDHISLQQAYLHCSLIL